MLCAGDCDAADAVRVRRPSFDDDAVGRGRLQDMSGATGAAKRVGSARVFDERPFPDGVHMRWKRWVACLGLAAVRWAPVWDITRGSSSVCAYASICESAHIRKQAQAMTRAGKGRKGR